MKKIALAALMFSACSGRHNELMTSLVNEKKALEDSIKSTERREKLFMSESRQAISDGKDSSVYLALADSSGSYYRKGQALQQRLNSIDFSIDSLSKMK